MLVDGVFAQKRCWGAWACWVVIKRANLVHASLASQVHERDVDSDLLSLVAPGLAFFLLLETAHLSNSDGDITSDVFLM